ncbi:vesicle coat component, partial [Hypocenomyce scalaris]|nr:vesicle coat component [Hypocenomyce scalaris]
MADHRGEGEGELGSWNPALRPNLDMGKASLEHRNESTEEPFVFDKHGADTPDAYFSSWAQEGGNLDLDGKTSKSRSNSFPEVPPLNGIEEVSQPKPLPQSQAEDVMEVNEGHSSPVNHNSVVGLDEGHDYFGDTANGDAHYIYTEVNGFQGDVVATPADDEARFEEGLPLMPSEPQLASTRSNEPRDQTDKAAAFDVEGDSGKMLLSDPSSESPVEVSPLKPQPLDRKTTSQVLNSLHLPDRSDSPLEASFDAAEPVDLHPIDLDNATVVTESPSGVIPTWEDSRTWESTEQPPGSKDQDLAALWKAALGDDDFLEDEPSSVDPSAFFEDDGDGFLQEGNHEEPTFEQLTQASPSAPPQPTYGIPHSNSAPLGFTNAGAQAPYSSVPTSLQRPGMPEKTQSYADKSKGGYTSPYDLPMDLTRPKKRTNLYQTQQGPGSPTFPQAPPPPPRSSSMQSDGTSPQVPSSAHPPTSHFPPSSFSSRMGNAQVRTSGTAAPSLKAKPSNTSFFEELPIVAKARASSSVGRFTPQPAQPALPPPQMPPQTRHTSLPQPMQRQASNSYVPSSAYQLLPPERIDPYAGVPQRTSATVPVPATNARYSPAPPAQGIVPAGINRYATHPTNASRAPPTQALPFQPRTSSPLAHNTSSAQKSQQFSRVAAPAIEHDETVQNDSGHYAPVPADVSAFSQGSDQAPIGLGVRRDGQFAEGDSTAIDLVKSLPSQSSVPAVNTRYAPVSNSQSNPPYAARPPSLDAPQLKRSISEYHPQGQPQAFSQDIGFNPPKRSQTISPSAVKSDQELPSSLRDPYQRPASVNDQVLPPATTSAYSTAFVQASGRARGFSQNQNYIKPSDGREFDPLERWKGSPILAFGFGGTVVTTFPKQIPRYGAGQTMPMLKCSPGEVKIHTDKVFPLDDDVASFPGPLRSRAKKKEVLEWLRKKIQAFGSEHNTDASSSILPDPLKRHGEKILLWKVLYVLVEYDGAIEGNLTALDVIRKLLSPELATEESPDRISHDSAADLVGISRSHGMKNFSEPVDPEAVEEVRTSLLKGEREKAVWLAVDKRLWAHAMLISSTMSKDVWRQVVQEFVRNEVKPFGDNTESLAALYEIFAGNWEGSIDELVPPSARAGLQMVSKAAGPGPTKNALDGLDRWRETLSLVLSNRSPGDAQALVALGRLLAGYGRTEAAHICYIFAKPLGIFSGVDDSHLDVSLLGADHSQQTFDQSHDLDTVLLTEVYEFALSVLASSAVSTVSPHLQSYKLYHAMNLAEYGYRSEAQQYCDTITSTLKSTTKPSPYYHSQLFGALDELTSRLKQAPKDGSASWISKPSMDKVSGSVWARFNSFVAGDESDTASVGSGKGVDPDAGPFAKIAGDTTSISRTQSASDLYGSYPPAGAVPIPVPDATVANSRYAPSGPYTPRSSLEQPGRSSQESPRSMPYEAFKPVLTQRHTSYQPISTDLYQKPEPDSYKLRSQPSAYTPPTDGYVPSQTEYMPVAPPKESSTRLYQQEAYQSTPPVQQQPFENTLQGSSSHSSYEPPRPSYDLPSTSADKPPSSDTYEPPSYEPPSSDGYEPPSYNSGTPDDESPLTQQPPKKKPFMDDDDEDFE